MSGSFAFDSREPQQLITNPGGHRKIAHVGVFSERGCNAGDILLPSALRDFVVLHSDGTDWISVHAREPVTPSTIDQINQSDGLIIGGGGLFLSDTNPNDESGWQWPCSIDLLEQIDVPMCVMAVGYNRFRGQGDFARVFTHSMHTLARKAVFVGLRNSGSVRAVRSYLPKELHDKVRLHPCLTTVIARLYPDLLQRAPVDPFIALNCAFDRSHLRYGAAKPQILDSIARAVSRVSQEHSIGLKYYSHFAPDEEMADVLSQHTSDFDFVDLSALDARGIIEAYRQPKLAIGMRGHAQMIPFGCRIPILSLISHDKLQWFLDDVNGRNWGVDLQQPQLESRIVDRALKVLADHDAVVDAIDAAQNTLWDVCVSNVREFAATLP